MADLVIYNYHGETFELVGKSNADPNPLEPGKWLIPANATTIAPPSVKENEVAIFVTFNEEWEVKVDFRGTKYWTDPYTEITIELIGEVVPEDAFMEQPLSPQEMPEAIEERWRVSELEATESCFVPDWGPIDWTDAQREKGVRDILDYRRVLKIGPDNTKGIEGYSASDWRPTWPGGLPRPEY